MYPNLYFFLKKVFGIEIYWLRFINTFGFFVAISFLVALRVIFIELKRKEKEGYFIHTNQYEIVGKAASISELLVQFFIGFIMGYKIIGLFLNSSNFSFNPQDYIFSMKGSIVGGVIIAFLFAFLKWYEKNKQKLDKPKTLKHIIFPKDRVNDLLMLAFVFGFLGAKLFHNLENWDTFVKDPIGEILSFGGLTFYGGLITAGAAIIFYLKMHKIPILHLIDAFATTMIIAYAIGRLGCQFAGDGDWGILNSAYISDIDGKVVSVNQEQYKQTLINNTEYYKYQFENLDKVPSINFKANILPQWFIAQNYPNNVLSEGFKQSDCDGQYCAYLPIAVFPTPLYESILGFIIFYILWILRKKMKYVGQLFGVYLILSGLERFFIEKIRVNSLYHIGNLAFTQAELISVILIVSGCILFIKVRKQNNLLIKK